MGRPKGSLNKVTLEVRSLCQKLLSDDIYRHNLQQRLSMGTAPPAVETMVWHYAYGKPADKLDVNVSNERQEQLQQLTDEQLAERAKQVAESILEGNKNTRETPEDSEYVM